MNKRIESIQNPLVKEWKKLIAQRKEREKSGEYLVEGLHLVEEALKAEGTVIRLIVCDGAEVPDAWLTGGVEVMEVTEEIARVLADTEATQGVFAHCRALDLPAGAAERWTRVLLLDAVQDPGNVGTLIRTAEAAGFDAVVLGKGSADMYNPKTIRSAQGAHFHIPAIKGDLLEWIGRLPMPVIGSSLAGDAVSVFDLTPPGRFVLLVGNEGSGVSEELLGCASKVVRVPMVGRSESLNVAVAAGILMYALAKPQ